MNLRGVVCFALLMVTASAILQAQEPLPAFPTAVGFGATATGGRGGDVYHVTSLADDGPGTLRHGVGSAVGPRTIVFEVGGIIELESSLDIGGNQLTIAGQTAPGGGITVAGYNTQIRGSTDVIVRFLRFRTGDFNAQFRGGGDGLGTPGVGNGNADLIGNNADGLSVHSSDRVVVDHCSASWSADETLSVTISKNITVQHCIVSESLNDAFHTSPHGLGSLVRGEVTAADRAAGLGGYTFFGNVWSHHTARNPGVGGQQTLAPGQSGADRRQLDLDFSNNVVYDWRNQSGHTVGTPESNLVAHINVERNYYVAGPSTREDVRGEIFRTPTNFLLFQAENLIDSDRDEIENPQPATLAAFSRAPGLVDTRFDFPPVVTLHADFAYQRAILHAGASLPRDEVDVRVINQVLTRTGGIIDSQMEVGGLAPIAAGTPPADTDRDGMSDDFENSNGLNAADPADRNGTELSFEGYTNLEVYLNGLAEIVFEPTEARFEPPVETTAGVEVQFDASASSVAPGRSIASYAWDFRDGNTAAGEQVAHTFTAIGVFRVALRVTDDRGLVSTTTQPVRVGFAEPTLEPWSETNVGEPAEPGFGGFVNGELQVFSGGTGFAARSQDQFYFVHQQLSGNFALVVRVAEIVRSGENTPLAGLTIRESLEPSSRHFSVVVERTGVHRPFSISRSVIFTRTTSIGTPHRWLRLERRGDTLIAFTSSDGGAWVEGDRRQFAFPATVFAGVVAAAVGEKEIMTARLESLTVEPIEPEFRRGDANSDGRVDISDPIRTLERFLRATVAPCEDASDANDDGELDISDAITTLEALFQGTGLLPVSGRLLCGEDPTADELPACEYAAACE